MIATWQMPDPQRWTRNNMKLYRTFQMNGEDIIVAMTTEEEIPDIKGCWGLARIEEGKIYLDEDIEDNFQEFYLHEVLHMMIGRDPWGKWLKGRRKPDVWARWEEKFVSTLAPLLVKTLIAAGWKPPRKPK